MNWLYSAEDLEQTVGKMGFLPFFRNEIPEFSIEEFTPAEHWFADGALRPKRYSGKIGRSLAAGAHPKNRNVD